MPPNFEPMHLIKQQEYEDYLVHHPDPASRNSRKVVGKIGEAGEFFGPPSNYEMETTTVWSFPDRGNWATHSGTYRGNWSPYIPRNLILKYTKEKDIILDQMCGSGTTAVECKLLNRNCLAVDINPNAAMLTLYNLHFSKELRESAAKVYTGDARNLNDIGNNSIDLIATHPPYANMIPYSKRTIEGDLSSLSITNYFQQMHLVARESFRVLKTGKYCAILIGDTRKHLHYVPIAFNVMTIFLEAGFLLKEDIIKLQWNMKGTREKWRGKSYDFYKIAHEHLFVFRKPQAIENQSKYKLSSIKGLNSVIS